MKLVSFETGGTRTYGLVVGDGIVDAGKRLGGEATDLRGALAQGLLGRIAALASQPADHSFDEVSLLPVIPNPAKIICVGVNYRTHLEETGRTPPEHPMLFMRFAESQVGAGQPMLRPLASEKFDFEGELAVVIGKGGRRISREDALEHVAGYACYNDGSVRDWQRHTTQFTPGKNFPSTGAFGPWMVTADEIPDPSALTLVTRLNGREVQSAVVSDLIFDIPALIAYCSTFNALTPGDVIVTGTTGGVGAYREPPLWMRDGDVVEIDISSIGVLRNPVVDEKDADAA